MVRGSWSGRGCGFQDGQCNIPKIIRIFAYKPSRSRLEQMQRYLSAAFCNSISDPESRKIEEQVRYFEEKTLYHKQFKYLRNLLLTQKFR